MSSSESQSQSFDRATQSSRIFAYLHRYRNLLRKHWWIPAITITLALGAQGWRMWNTPPTYTFVGKMVVNVKVAASSSGPIGAYDEERVNFNGTQVALMQSGTVLKHAEERVHALHPEVPSCLVSLAVNVLPRTSVFQLVAVGSEPRYTQLFLDACMEEFITFKREMVESATDKTAMGIRDELQRLQKELDKGDQELIEFQSSNSVQVLEGETGSAKTQLGEWQRHLNEMKVNYDVLQKLNLEQSIRFQGQPSSTMQVNEINNPSDTATNLAASGAGYMRLKQTLQLKKAEREVLSKDLRPKHPKMIASADEIDREEKLLAILLTQSSEERTNMLAELKHNIDTLETQISSLNGKALGISRKMAEYKKINDNIDRNQKLFDQYRVLLKNIETTVGADPASVVINEHATGPVPTSKNLIRQLALAFIAGLALGSGLLFIMDRLDDRPTSFTELQSMFDEPVLGQVPAEKAFAKGGDIQLLQPDDNRHAFVEAYRNLRSSLLYMATEGKRAKTILVTSAIPNDGKSMSTANIAITLAQSGSRVLLVDADLRRGQLHKRLGIEFTIGFTEVLQQELDWRQSMKSTKFPTLSLMPRGSLCKNPGELFLKPFTLKFLKETAAEYDYVIIDTAPVMAADDVGSLSPHVEGVIFVIRAGQTSARVARAALDVLYQREVNVLGILFNGVEAAATEYYFYKYKDYSVYPGA